MKLVEHFNKVRDIPYSIPIHQEDEDNCCNGKVRKLKNLVEREGYKTRYRVCTFRWSDLNLPKEILELQKEDLATHVYLEVLIEENWIKVDPTWDSGLKNIFPIAEWNGKDDTILAIKPIEIYSVEESDKIMNDCAPENAASIQTNDKNDFDFAFNRWLNDNRIK